MGREENSRFSMQNFMPQVELKLHQDCNVEEKMAPVLANQVPRRAALDPTDPTPDINPLSPILGAFRQRQSSHLCVVLYGPT